MLLFLRKIKVIILFITTTIKNNMFTNHDQTGGWALDQRIATVPSPWVNRTPLHINAIIIITIANSQCKNLSKNIILNLLETTDHLYLNKFCSKMFSSKLANWHFPGMLTWAPSPSGRLQSLFISLSLFHSGFSRCQYFVRKRSVNFESAPSATIWWSWNSQWWCWWPIRIAPFFWHLLFKFMYFLHFCNLQCLCCRSQNSSLDGRITLQSQKRWWPFLNQPSVDLDPDFRYTEWDCWTCYHWW